MKIVFLILGHKQIELVYKQIMFLDHPDHFFFIHLDKKYNPEIKSDFLSKSNVYFCNNRQKISWGGFSIVQGTLNLIQQVVKLSPIPDYFVLLSGQCLPVKSLDYIRTFFKENKGKSFIEIMPLPDDRLPGGGLDKFKYPWFFDQLRFIKKDTIKFFGKCYEYKKLLQKGLKGILKKLNIERKLPGDLIPCYGSQWWALHNTSIEYILEYIKEYPEMIRFFKYTWAPDELFFQTILYNSHLRNTLVDRSLWYIDWNTNGPPKTLTLDHYKNIVSEKTLFARKFDLNISGKLILAIEKNMHFYNSY